MNVYIYILKIPVYLQILFDVNLNFIEQFDSLEIFCYFGGINLSEKCVNVRNADMRRDPCYDQLGVRWYLFKKVAKAFHIFRFKCLAPQAFDGGQAVCINNKILGL